MSNSFVNGCASSGGTGMKRSLILSELKVSGRKLVSMINNYLNLETEYLNLMVQKQNEQPTYY